MKSLTALAAALAALLVMAAAHAEENPASPAAIAAPRAPEAPAAGETTAAEPAPKEGAKEQPPPTVPDDDRGTGLELNFEPLGLLVFSSNLYFLTPAKPQVAIGARFFRQLHTTLLLGLMVQSTGRDYKIDENLQQDYELAGITGESTTIWLATAGAKVRYSFWREAAGKLVPYVNAGFFYQFAAARDTTEYSKEDLPRSAPAQTASEKLADQMDGWGFFAGAGGEYFVADCFGIALTADLLGRRYSWQEAYAEPDPQTNPDDDENHKDQFIVIDKSEFTLSLVTTLGINFYF